MVIVEAEKVFAVNGVLIKPAVARCMMVNVVSLIVDGSMAELKLAEQFVKQRL